MSAPRPTIRQRLTKLAVAAAVFTTIVGGWAWAGPFVTRRLPLPDRVATSGDDCAVWFVGSSSIERWQSLERDMPGWRQHNRGINGALLDQIDSRLLATRSRTPPVAIVAYAGENDINAGATGPQAAQAMARLFLDARQAWPETPFFIVGLKPSPARWDQRPEQLKYNTIVADFAQRQRGVTFLPAGDPLMKGALPDPALFADGVHMNDRGYAAWSRDIRRGFVAAMPPALRTTCAARTVR